MLRNAHKQPVMQSVEHLIFASRLLLLPLYLGLIVALALYLLTFLHGIWDMAVRAITHISDMDKNGMLISILGLLDIARIANLVVMATVEEENNHALVWTF